MSDGPVKAEFQDRIDTLRELAETEHQIQILKTQFQQAQHEVVRSAEQLLEWQELLGERRRAVFARYPDAVPVEKVMEEAQAVIDRFCAEVRANNERFANLTPQDAPDLTVAVAEPEVPDQSETTESEPDPAQRSVEIDGEWIDGDDEAGLKRSDEYSQGYEAGRLGHVYVAGNSEDWLTGYADGEARRDEVAASEGYAPVVAADEPEPEPSLLDRFNPFRVKADA